MTPPLRPGRFDRQIPVSSPDLAGRKAVLRVHAQGKPLAPDADLDGLAKRTVGMSGADLANVINEAALLTARENGTIITGAALEEAVDRVIGGPRRKGRVISETEKKITATTRADTRWPRGPCPTSNRSTKSPSWRAAAPAVTLFRCPGRQGPDDAIGDDRAVGLRDGRPGCRGTGVPGAHHRSGLRYRAGHQDRPRDGHRVRHERQIGAVRYGTEHGDPFLGRTMGTQADYSHEVARDIDDEVRKLIEAAHTEAWAILTEYRDVLDVLAGELLEKETLHRAELEAIFGNVRKRPRLTMFDDFGGRVPSDKPPIKTPGSWPSSAASRGPSPCRSRPSKGDRRGQRRRAGSAGRYPGAHRQRKRDAPGAGTRRRRRPSRRLVDPLNRTTAPRPVGVRPDGRRLSTSSRATGIRRRRAGTRPSSRTRRSRATRIRGPISSRRSPRRRRRLPVTMAVGPTGPIDRHTQLTDGPSRPAEPVRTAEGGQMSERESITLDTPVFDQHRAEAAVRELLLAVGEDPDRDGLRATPARVARAFREMFAGLYTDPDTVLDTTFDEGHEELVLVKQIPMYSTCEHHLVAFHGMAHVGYIPGPDGRVTGLSKLARVVDLYAKRPQVQERLTAQVADAVMRKLNPRGVIVVIEAEHLCMAMRGCARPARSPRPQRFADCSSPTTHLEPRRWISFSESEPGSSASAGGGRPQRHRGLLLRRRPVSGSGERGRTRPDPGCRWGGDHRRRRGVDAARGAVRIDASLETARIPPVIRRLPRRASRSASTPCMPRWPRRRWITGQAWSTMSAVAGPIPIWPAWWPGPECRGC